MCGDICSVLQASMLQRVHTLTALMQQALLAANQHAAQALPALVVTFAATQIQVTYVIP